MNKSIYMTLILIITGSFQALKSQDYLENIHNYLWPKTDIESDYRAALNLIKQNRASAGDHIFTLDLYKTICYCGLEQYQDGNKYLSWMRRSYRYINPQLVEYMDNIESACSNTAISVSPPDQEMLAANAGSSPGEPARVEGKEFFERSPDYYKTEVLRTISSAEYKSRLFQTADYMTLKGHIENYGITEAAIDTSQHFIVIMPNSAGKEETAHNISRNLEKALSFYQTFYNLQIPDYKITAYSCATKPDFYALSDTLHGLQLNRSLIGYSSQPDLSMVVYNPLMNAGTLKHELLHILFNYNVPFLDPWLAEGIPALYEVSVFSVDSLFGVSAWRDKLLSRLALQDEMDLNQLLTMNWDSFSAWESQEINSLFKSSLARTFILYLQNERKLQDVFQAYRNQDPLQYNHYIITSVLQKDISEIQSDFIEWFNGLH